MKHALTLLLTLMLWPSLLETPAQAESKPKIVSTSVVWGSAPTSTTSDILRFKDRWYCALEESGTGDVCVVRSSDGRKWESVLQKKLPSPRRGDRDPQLAITTKGKLTLAAARSFPRTTRQTMLWFSKDGRKWGNPLPLPDANFIHTDFSRHKGVTYSYGFGCICGIAQTVHIFANTTNRVFEKHYEQTFSGFFPGSASLVFDGDKGYCLMGRRRNYGYLGRAKAPFNDWRWKIMKAQFSDPNTIRLPDGRIVAAVGLHKARVRTSLCWFNTKTGELREFLELPTNGAAQRLGLAYHAGHLWVTYQAHAKGQYSVHLAKVKIGKR